MKPIRAWMVVGDKGRPMTLMFGPTLVLKLANPEPAENLRTIEVEIRERKKVAKKGGSR